MNQIRSIRELLERKQIVASTPCRIDVGGTWDLKALALLYEYIRPCTVNFALDMRTKVILRPYKDGSVRVVNGYADESYPVESMPFDSHFGLVFAIASYFGVHGVEINISYDAPRMSGLGGSGSLAVAVVAAIGRMLDIPDYEGSSSNSKRRIVEIAHDIEDGLRYSYTGLQDQCAAAYGGITQWYWHYGRDHDKFEGYQIIGNYEECASHMVLAYIGGSHNSSDVNSQQVAYFHSGKTLDKWFRINEITTEFARSLKRRDWQKAARLVQEGHDIQVSMVPSRITPIGVELQAATRAIGAGFAVVGAGNGGCVWALCPTVEQAEQVKERWRALLQVTESGKLLDCNIDSEGLIINVEDITNHESSFCYS